MPQEGDVRYQTQEPLGELFDGREWRKLGLTEPKLRDEPPFRQYVPIIPRNQWKERDNRRKVRRVFDQDGVGSCASEATVQGLEVVRFMGGNDPVDLSPGNLYGRVNGGSDNGSNLTANIEEIATRGVCTEAIVPHCDWQHWNNPGWEESGRRYRALEVYAVDRGVFDACGSAIMQGFCCTFGIRVGSNFRVDQATGWVGEYAASGFSGHGLLAIGLGKHPIGGQWGIQFVNSWSEGWGWGGFAWLPESYFDSYQYDGYAIRAAVDPTGDAD